MQAYVGDNIYNDRELSSFTVSGDPGCDGYNVESVLVLEAIVRQKADFHLLLGDMVPTGRERWFQEFSQILDRSAQAPVFCLAGNHDLPDYEKHLGKKNYYIRYRNAILILLDNANRTFSDDTLAFLQTTLADFAVQSGCVFLAFHVPPPNPYSPNSMAPEQWERLRGILQPYQDRVQGILAGHVHSAFACEVDGFNVIVSGGGGARLDPVENTFLTDNRHHLLWARLHADKWSFTAEAILPGDGIDYQAEDHDLRLALAQSFAGECQASLRYGFFATRARLLGQPGLARLFLAAADSEKVHANNMLLALGEIADNQANLKESIRREETEWRHDYVRHLETAKGAVTSLGGATVFASALAAEKIHHSLFQEALEILEKGGEVPEKRYFTCSRCGFTHAGDKPPAVCPVCGTDDKRFVEAPVE
ncbi:MAG: metallophosphoesterase [Planctomycetota bacterium]|jgi:rubrerythrin/predicted phosphodiesterase|nr:metallophosphoesterase [Planctomycetota bacterium]